MINNQSISTSQLSSSYTLSTDTSLSGGLIIQENGEEINVGKTILQMVEDIKDIKDMLLIINRDKILEEKYQVLKEAKEKYEDILSTLIAFEEVAK